MAEAKKFFPNHPPSPRPFLDFSRTREVGTQDSSGNFMTFFRRCLLALLILAAAPAAAAGDADWLYRGSDIPRDEGWTVGP